MSTAELTNDPNILTTRGAKGLSGPDRCTDAATTSQRGYYFATAGFMAAYLLYIMSRRAEYMRDSECANATSAWHVAMFLMVLGLGSLLVYMIWGRARNCNGRGVIGYCFVLVVFGWLMDLSMRWGCNHSEVTLGQG